MAAADLHGDDDEFRQGLELSGERGVCAWVALAEAYGAVSGDDFEEDGEEAEGVFVCVFEAGAFDDGDEEEAEEDEPEIEGELAAEMVREVAGLCVVEFVVGPDAEGFFFVDVGLADGHGDGEDGDVHHDKVADLDGGVQVGDVDHGETSGTGRGGLEETGEEAVAAGEGCDGWIIEIEDDEEDEIDTVEDNQDPE